MAKKKILNGYHKVQPVMPVNKFNSRFAYRIFVDNKPIAGLWTIDSVDVNEGATIYKKYTKKQST